MYASSRLLPQLILIASLGFTATYTHAVAPTKDTSCFSNLQITLFAKESLPSLQSIDPTVSLTDAKNVIKSVGDCITLEAATLAIDEYAASLSPNSPPTIAGTPVTSLAESESYFFTPSVYDPDGDELSFSIVNAPIWASFDASSGALSGTPGFDDAGSYINIVISVSDGTATASLSAFSIDVVDTNRSPSISGTPITSLAENESYAFIPSTSDADGDSLVFSILNAPAWASFDASSGALSGTPGFDDAGSYTNIVISVSDGTATASLSAFSIDVVDTNRSPSISGTPIISLAESESYSFIPSTSDADGDSLVFSILNAPAWASFDASSGALSGTPGFDDAGSYINIVISVSDGTATVSLSAFSIDVFNTNRAPSISGTPLLSVAVNEIYSFIPSAIDPDGDELTFDILNLPSWASFDPTTGEFSGTPTIAGVYTDIEISVSDGMITTALSTISISVVELPVADVSANLTWVSPTTRTDGSFLTLSEIGGYRIYMGQTQDNLNMLVDLNGGLDTSYNVTSLTTGTYYFAVTAYDIDGNESSFSNVAVKNI